MDRAAIAKLLMYFQFHRSYYFWRALRQGSWYDAEKGCNKYNAHLWSINSYEEWWNVYLSLGMAQHQPGKISTNVDSINVMLSIVSYIGGQIHGKVSINYSTHVPLIMQNE